MLSKRQYQQIQ